MHGEKRRNKTALTKKRKNLALLSNKKGEQGITLKTTAACKATCRTQRAVLRNTAENIYIAKI